MTRELLKARFTTPRRHLDQVLDRLTDADLDWAPREGMRTVAGQLFETVAKEVEVLAWIRNGVWDDDLAYEKSFPTLAAWRQELATVRGATFRFIDGLSDEELVKPVANPRLWQEALNLPECPTAEVIGFIASHEWYHTGQLIAYMWARGDDPYQW